MVHRRGFPVIPKSAVKAIFFMEIYQLKLCLTLACAPYRNDVCLLFTKEPFDLNGQTVKQLPIGTEDICRAGADCLVAGWGKTKVCS